MKRTRTKVHLALSTTLVVCVLAALASLQTYNQKWPGRHLGDQVSTLQQQESEIKKQENDISSKQHLTSTEHTFFAKLEGVTTPSPGPKEKEGIVDGPSLAIRERTRATPTGAPLVPQTARKEVTSDRAKTSVAYGLGAEGYAQRGMIAGHTVSSTDYWKNDFYAPHFHTEAYDRIYSNEFMSVSENPLSTFSIDVDTASYSNVRRFLNRNQLPPKDAVRIEEMINYFVYDYPQPKGDEPFSITLETGPCPWNRQNELVMIGLKGKELAPEATPPSNLVFLIDVSGSMANPEKLPLLKSAFRMMALNLRPEERISIVTYAGTSSLALEGVPGSDKATILSALERLTASGSTAGGQGIKHAYDVAKRNYIPNGNNRVILATDGDFNVGMSSDAEMVRLIEEKREDGIFLTVLGFGMGNYKDAKMEKIANKGNGNFYYIDTIKEAEKVLVRELGSMLFTIAQDVKLQIEFNPEFVKAYRLVGYENRVLTKEDFNDDTKDAGELGAGHTVTAFYEIVPAAAEEEFRSVDPLKYQQSSIKKSDELMSIKLRYKKPAEQISRLIERPLTYDETKKNNASADFQFASAVAEFGLILRDSPFKANASISGLLSRARESASNDKWGYRQEFIELVEKARGFLGVPNDDNVEGDPIYGPEQPMQGYNFK